MTKREHGWLSGSGLETSAVFDSPVRAVLEVCDEFDRGKDSQRRGAEATAAPVALELPTP
jgi:hypothetical protein